MNIERAAMRGKLAEAKEKKFRLKNKFEALATAVRTQLNTALTDIEDIPMDELSPMFSDLELTWAEILALRSEIEKLERRLT